MTRPRPRLVLVLVVALVLGACRAGGAAGPVVQEGAVPPTLAVPVAPQEPPALAEVPAPSPPDWAPCGGGFECATVAVPLDYDDPAGPTVDLAVARRPAADPGARRGVLAVNPGGPGASGIEMARSDGVVGPYGDRFDVVGWDPRTTGGSAPLDCGNDHDLMTRDPSPDHPAEQEVLEGAAQRIALRCAGAGGDLLAHVDSVVAARDLDQVRRALGEEQLSYLGVSYGTLLGQEYARQFPGRVRAMVLDGVVDPAEDLPSMLTGQAVAAEAALGELAPAYDRLAARVEARPLPDGAGDPIGPGLLAVAAVAATYTPGGHGALAEALARGEAGDGTPLGRLADRYLDGGVSFDSYLAVSCVDSPRPAGPEGWRAFAAELAAAAPRFGPSVAAELLPCAWWPVAPTRTSSPVAPTGLAPVLVSSTTGDVATPLAAAQRVAATLPGAVLLTTEGGGHGATFQSACARRVAVAYLADLVLPEPGSVCAA